MVTFADCHAVILGCTVNNRKKMAARATIVPIDQRILDLVDIGHAVEPRPHLTDAQIRS